MPRWRGERYLVVYSNLVDASQNNPAWQWEWHLMFGRVQSSRVSPSFTLVSGENVLKRRFGNAQPPCRASFPTRGEGKGALVGLIYIHMLSKMAIPKTWFLSWRAEGAGDPNCE